MSTPVVQRGPKSWRSVVGRFVLALVLIFVSGTLTNAGYGGMLLSVLALVALGVLIWAVVGVCSLLLRRRARQD